MSLFSHPFQAAYWQAAVKEANQLRMWLIAALLVAIRVALKSVRIPIMENLYVSVGFLPNALGSMLYGPVIALFAGLASDTLGALLFPVGAYFPPFALVEMLGSLLFALFLYRAPVTIFRIAASKLSVNVLCNIILTPLMLAWMQGRAALLTSLPRIAKNLLLFPLEAFLLTLLIGAMLPALRQMGLLAPGQAKPTFDNRQLSQLAVLFIAAAAFVFLYYRAFLSGA